jgi:hypothetical protein
MRETSPCSNNRCPIGGLYLPRVYSPPTSSARLNLSFAVSVRAGIYLPSHLLAAESVGCVVSSLLALVRVRTYSTAAPIGRRISLRSCLLAVASATLRILWKRHPLGVAAAGGCVRPLSDMSPAHMSAVASVHLLHPSAS